MISYPIYNNIHDACEFKGTKFVRNIGPNFDDDDGLIGWIEFDENDDDTLASVVRELTLNTSKWINIGDNEYEELYKIIMRRVKMFITH